MIIPEKYQLLQQKIQPLLANSPKLLILGIGENRMGDDGAGQFISFGLDQFNQSSNICIINGGITPEERLQEIIDFQPDLMLIIDVIDLPSPRGSIDVFDESQLVNYLPISSHSMPLPVFVDRCHHGIPHLSMKLIGIRPYSLEFLDQYALYEEDKYSLDDKEQNLNIPFYAFNLTHEMKEICDNLINLFHLMLNESYSIEI